MKKKEQAQFQLHPSHNLYQNKSSGVSQKQILSTTGKLHSKDKPSMQLFDLYDQIQKELDQSQHLKQSIKAKQAQVTIGEKKGSFSGKSQALPTRRESDAQVIDVEQALKQAKETHLKAQQTRKYYQQITGYRSRDQQNSLKNTQNSLSSQSSNISAIKQNQIPTMPRNSTALSPHQGFENLNITGSRSQMDKTPLKDKDDNDHEHNSQNLSDKFSGFNGRKMIVKNQPKFKGNTHLKIEQANNNRSQSLDQTQTPQSSKVQGGGFFNNFNGQKAFSNAYAFLQKFQDKFKDLVQQSPVRQPENEIQRRNFNKSIDFEYTLQSGDKTQQLNFSANSRPSLTKAKTTLYQYPFNENTNNIQNKEANSFECVNSPLTSLRINNTQQKRKPIKPSEKLADDPIDPPSPRGTETVCLNCQQKISTKMIQEHQVQCRRRQQRSELQPNIEEELLTKIDKLIQALDNYIQDLPKFSNDKDEMHATSVKLYANRLKDDIKAKQNSYTNKDYEQCKELIQNIQFQEYTGGVSSNILIFTQRLKVLCRDRLNIIVKYLKDNNIKGFKLETSSVTGSIGPKTVASDSQRSKRDDLSEERLKERMEEVSKTIKEKEMLQKRTSDLIYAIQNKSNKKVPIQDPSILQKGQFVISDIKSDVDNQTYISDGSSKTQNSYLTQQSGFSNILQGINVDHESKLMSKSVHSNSRNMLGSEGDELEEVLQIQNNKREKELKQNNKIQFYELCFQIKNKQFPENHLAKYANIPALYEEALKRKISMDKYQEFIYNELSKNAQLWVSMKEINQIRKKTNAQSPKNELLSQNLNEQNNLIKKETSNMQQYRRANNSSEPKKLTLNGNKHNVNHSAGKFMSQGNKALKIETIMEEDDAQLSLYND